MSFARDVASEVVFLHQGRIEEQGAPARMFGDPPSDRFRQFLSTFGNGRPGSALTWEADSTRSDDRRRETERAG